MVCEYNPVEAWRKGREKLKAEREEIVESLGDVDEAYLDLPSVVRMAGDSIKVANVKAMDYGLMFSVVDRKTFGMRSNMALRELRKTIEDRAGELLEKRRIYERAHFVSFGVVPEAMTPDYCQAMRIYEDLIEGVNEALEAKKIK